MAYVDSVEASATAPREPVDAFGPIYPALNATAAKGRRVADPTREQRRAHGEAVGAAIRELQRRELQREAPPHRCPCASGTWHSGDDLTKAIRRQHDAALQAQAKADRARRTDAQVKAQYEAAMAERRAQEAAPTVGGGRVAESEAARGVASSARGQDPMEAAVMKADPALLRDVLRREPAGRLRDLAAARLVELEAGPGPVAESDAAGPALQVGRENRHGPVTEGDASGSPSQGEIREAQGGRASDQASDAPCEPETPPAASCEGLDAHSDNYGAGNVRSQSVLPVWRNLPAERVASQNARQRRPLLQVQRGMAQEAGIEGAPRRTGSGIPQKSEDPCSMQSARETQARDQNGARETRALRVVRQARRVRVSRGLWRPADREMALPRASSAYSQMGASHPANARRSGGGYCEGPMTGMVLWGGPQGRARCPSLRRQDAGNFPVHSAPRAAAVPVEIVSFAAESSNDVASGSEAVEDRPAGRVPPDRVREARPKAGGRAVVLSHERTKPALQHRLKGVLIINRADVTNATGPEVEIGLIEGAHGPALYQRGPPWVGPPVRQSTADGPIVASKGRGL